MPSFVHPLLLWGLPVMAAPVLIHLINMMRHRRIEWAAMEFLLVSQRKHRTWIILKQLLLLLMRILAIAAVVFMVAQPLLRNQLGNLFGNLKTHHIVLLDDSFSMSDHWGDTNAFDQAKAVVDRIGAAAARESQQQNFTLVRFSQPGRSEPDFVRERVDNQFPARLTGKLQAMNVSQTAAEPLGVFTAIDQLLGDAGGERRIIYLITDFRTRQWDNPTELKKRLEQFNKTGAELRLIDCVDASRSNLAITSLAPADGIRAAGVSWFMEVAVTNFGTTPVKDVPVLLSEDGHPRAAVTIKEIPAGRVVKERFPVFFPLAGEHRIDAKLEGDAVTADNYRYAVIDLPTQVPVLVVDGDTKAEDAGFLSVVMAPGVGTGLQPRTETAQFLVKKPLGDFQTINLANFDRLDKSAIDALEQYVRNGGGVAFFLGPKTDANFINQAMYREGKGIFPVPLAGPSKLPESFLEKTPDIDADTKHFLFRPFAGQKNGILDEVVVTDYFKARSDWKPKADAPVPVLAKLRNGDPLVVERSFGKGRVVVFLTTAAPTWNDWRTTPAMSSSCSTCRPT